MKSMNEKLSTNDLVRLAEAKELRGAMQAVATALALCPSGAMRDDLNDRLTELSREFVKRLTPFRASIPERVQQFQADLDRATKSRLEKELANSAEDENRIRPVIKPIQWQVTDSGGEKWSGLDGLMEVERGNHLDMWMVRFYCRSKPLIRCRGGLESRERAFQIANEWWQEWLKPLLE